MIDSREYWRNSIAVYSGLLYFLINQYVLQKLNPDSCFFYPLSLYTVLMYRGEALEDFTGPDCRFMNFKKGDTVYVYYKLSGRSPEVWAGSVSKNWTYFIFLLFIAFFSSVDLNNCFLRVFDGVNLSSLLDFEKR